MFDVFFKVTILIIAADFISCTISGMTYMDPLQNKPKTPGYDPCNPLYWYPRSIPEYCYQSVIPGPDQYPRIAPPQPGPLPSPAPIPLPPPIPLPIPPPVPLPLPLPVPIPMPPPMPWQYPMPAPPPLPFLPPMPFPAPIPPGMPNIPLNPLLIVPQAPYPNVNPYTRSLNRAGLVPGIPGIVSDDGGINILPFSDAYSDMLNKHKDKMLRKRLKKLFKDYDDYPRHRRYRYRKHG